MVKSEVLSIMYFQIRINQPGDSSISKDYIIETRGTQNWYFFSSTWFKGLHSNINFQHRLWCQSLISPPVERWVSTFMHNMQCVACKMHIMYTCTRPRTCVRGRCIVYLWPDTESHMPFDILYIIYVFRIQKKLFNWIYVSKRQGKLWQKQLWQVSLKAGDSLSLSCQVKRKTIGLRYSSVVAFDYSSMQTRFDTAESFKAAKYFRWGVSVSWVGCDKFSENVSFHKVHILKLAFWQ